MRILVLGKNYSALKFVEYFEKKEENVVFSTMQNAKNFIEFTENKDIVDFCLANEINLVLVIQKEYLNSYLVEDLTDNQISVLAPNFEASEIVCSKVQAKRFMHKFQIPNSKFFIAEKPQLAFEYLKNASFPVAIKPDFSTFQEGTLFAETIGQAQTIIENFFNSGNKKIVLEDYIEGKNISIWTISDGYKAQIIGSSVKYQNDVALFNPNFLTQEIKTKIQETIINPTIKALAENDSEYVGILGFDIILTKNDTPILLSYNSFFDDINVDFYFNDIDFCWEDVFNSTIIGDIFLKYSSLNFAKYSATLRIDEKIENITANTSTNLKRLIKELELESEEFKEAKEKWKN